jgi:hypothetical protein
MRFARRDTVLARACKEQLPLCAEKRHGEARQAEVGRVQARKRQRHQLVVKPCQAALRR